VGAQKIMTLIGIRREKTAREDPDGNKVSVTNWARGNSCYILAKNLSTLCLCQEMLGEAEFKDNKTT
jgi:hypothetical protein